MCSQRIVWGLVLGFAAFAAAAQTQGTLRWRAGVAPLGLQPAGSAHFGVVGQAGIAPQWGLYGYGRVGTLAPRTNAWSAEGGVTYGVGLSWDITPRTSATLGWDSYDLRTLGGDNRDVRATSLGLQWRY